MSHSTFVAWLVHICDMIDSYVYHDSVVWGATAKLTGRKVLYESWRGVFTSLLQCVAVCCSDNAQRWYDLFDLHISMTWLMCMSEDTGWRRCIGCLKLQVSFRKRATNYRALWRKRTYQHKASYASSPPCSAPQGFQYIIRVMAQSHVSRGSCSLVTWFIHICDMTHLYEGPSNYYTARLFTHNASHGAN